VGFAEGVAFDPARSSWDGNGLRPLSWVVWYPAVAGAVETPPPAPSWFLNGPVAYGAALRGTSKPYQVILLSHGTGGVAAGLEWLGRRLAERGFVALAVNHHGNTGTEPYRPEGFVCLWERALDLSAVFDDSGWRKALSGHFNDHAYVAGFSAGAYTAMLLMGARAEYSQFEKANPKQGPVRGPREFPDLADKIPALMKDSAIFRQSWERRLSSFCDDRFRAALVLAPGRSVLGFSQKSLAKIRKPVRIVVGDSDEVAPSQECARWLREHVGNSELEVLGSGVGHYIFLPEPTTEGLRTAPDIFIDASGVDRRAIHDRVVASAIDFFGRVSSR
jgi:predicted dienelactone hydrolase